MPGLSQGFSQYSSCLRCKPYTEHSRFQRRESLQRIRRLRSQGVWREAQIQWCNLFTTPTTIKI